MMVFSIFLNGYVAANTTNATDSELATEIQNELATYEIIPNVTNPLSTVTASYDFDSDDSFQRFLTTSRPFKDINYVPSDLAPINSNFTSNDARKFKLRQKAGDEFADMAWHFRNEFS